GIIRKSILKIGIHRQRRRRGDLARVFEHDRARNELRVVGQSFTKSESGRRGRDRLKSEMLEIDRRSNIPGVRQHETSGLVQFMEFAYYGFVFVHLCAPFVSIIFRRSMEPEKAAVKSIPPF